MIKEYEIGDFVRVKGLKTCGVIVQIQHDLDFVKYKVASFDDSSPKFWNHSSLIKNTKKKCTR